MAAMRAYKMTGSGNDFVMLDGRVTQPEAWTADAIRAICDRRTGVGADGFVILEPMQVGAVRMHFYNSDGGRAAMCGNAALCSTRLSARLGLAAPEQMRLVADAGPMETRCVGPGDMAEIRLGDCPLPATPSIVAEAGEHWLTLATVGVPHLAIRVDDVDAVDLPRRGRELRWHAGAGPTGANANFVSPPASGSERWRVRTYERGVEGETLACGTGTVAVALSLAATGEAALPIPFVSRGGAPLAVSGQLDGALARDVWLCGQGRLVFEAEYHPA